MLGDVGITNAQVKRTEEGAQLLLPAESKVTDGTPGVVVCSNSGTIEQATMTNTEYSY